MDDARDEGIFQVCGATWLADLPPLSGPADDYRLLCNEPMRLMLARQRFTFVAAAPVTGTNDESERTLRSPAMARNTGRTNKTARGIARRTASSRPPLPEASPASHHAPHPTAARYAALCA